MSFETHPKAREISSATSLSVSVIIPTRERVAALEQTLATLLSQTVVPGEVVIIDQSSGDETSDLVDSTARALVANGRRHPAIVYIRDRSLRGAGPARNRGIEASSGAILLFLDDDVLLEPLFLSELLDVYASDSAVGMVSGIITNYSKPAFRNRLFDSVFCVGPFRDERLPIYWAAADLRSSAPVPVRKMSGGVMSVRRSTLGTDRFDNAYTGRGEDVDLSWRVSERTKSVLTPRARLIHVCTPVARTWGHWLTGAVSSLHYLYYRHWRKGITNRLCFCWLNSGLIAFTAVSILRSRSVKPLKAFLEGRRLVRLAVAANRAETR